MILQVISVFFFYTDYTIFILIIKTVLRIEYLTYFKVSKYKFSIQKFKMVALM